MAPKKVTEIPYKDTIQTRTMLFGASISLFNRRFQCLNMRMSTMKIKSITELAYEVNRAYQSAELSTITSNQMTTLLFVTALDLSKFQDIR